MPTGRRSALACAGALSWCEQIVLLGDYVGYGADPEWTVTTVMDLVDQGAVAVLGNHDSAVSNPREQLNVEAQVVIEWTRGELGVLTSGNFSPACRSLGRQGSSVRPFRGEQPGSGPM